MMTPAERAANGATLFDTCGLPEAQDWYTKMQDFDITEPCECIVGRTFLDFTRGLDALKLFTPEERIAHGFALTGSDRGNDDLQNAWEYEIQKRLNAKGTA